MMKRATPMSEPDIRDLAMRAVNTTALEKDDLEQVHHLFDLSYSQANHAYLEKSFTKLRYIALATSGESLVGFAVADTVETLIPRMEDQQIVTLAGICCVDANYRRVGLFKKLEILAAGASGILHAEKRVLLCGRMAHPVSFRTMRGFPSVIPKMGVPLSDWHKEMGLRVAELYGSTLDPETLVIMGNGTPIGYPNIDYEVADEEWLPFQAVNRDRGDALLGIFWFPDAPEGW
jgi:hypothetical protein